LIRNFWPEPIPATEYKQNLSGPRQKPFLFPIHTLQDLGIPILFLYLGFGSDFVMSASTFDFPVLNDTRPDDHSIPAFMVSTTRGFLPRQEPVIELPSEFAAVESLLQRMPVKTLSGEPGLLADFTFGDTLLKDLPDLTGEVEKYRDDLVVMNALYRDYSFLASAYLLEPCHERFLKGEPYGLGRQSLPRSIALPIVKVADM
jgi:indoleamine 2,3-dioxygenase